MEHLLLLLEVFDSFLKMENFFFFVDEEAIKQVIVNFKVDNFVLKKILLTFESSDSLVDLVVHI